MNLMSGVWERGYKKNSVIWEESGVVVLDIRGSVDPTRDKKGGLRPWTFRGRSIAKKTF